MLNKGEVLNKPHANVVCTVCHKRTSFENIAGLCNISKYNLMKYYLWQTVQVFQKYAVQTVFHGSSVTFATFYTSTVHIQT